MGARRRLSRRQQARIRKLQEARRERARSETRHGPADAGQALGPEQTGLVISHHGAALIIEDGQGGLNRCAIRRNLEALVCGDRVVWQASGTEKGVVVALQPRRSLLSRPDPGGDARPLAANIDQIIIVAATRPEPSEHLIDRYLVAAHATDIRPVILLNKIDLLQPQEQTALETRLRVYREIGYRILYTSVKREHGIEPLRRQLEGHTSILVGQSGVGKSSLVKALLPEREIRIGELTGAHHGRHTTTVSVLYHLACGGNLIDSPGVRDFGVWHIGPEQIARGFIEFHEYLGRCRFSDCSHTIEPACALRQAVREGRISARRLDSYHRIMQTLGESRSY